MNKYTVKITVDNFSSTLHNIIAESEEKALEFSRKTYSNKCAINYSNDNGNKSINYCVVREELTPEDLKNLKDYSIIERRVRFRIWDILGNSADAKVVKRMAEHITDGLFSLPEVKKAFS